PKPVAKTPATDTRAIIDKPYVTTGMVVFHDAPPAAAPAVPAGRSPEQLRQRVLGVCAGAAQDVRVQVRPDSSLQVTVKVPSSVQEKQRSEKILQLPEMGGPNIHLSVEILP